MSGSAWPPRRCADRAFEIGERTLQVGGRLQRAQPHVARRLQRLQIGRDVGLSQAIRVLGHALDFDRLRQNLVAIADVLLALRLRDRRSAGDLAEMRANVASRSPVSCVSVACSTATPAVCDVKIGSVIASAGAPAVR